MLADAVCLCMLAGFAINAAVAFERQLGQMFFPLLSLATIVRNNPYYPAFNASFDRVAKELMDEVRKELRLRFCVAGLGALLTAAQLCIGSRLCRKYDDARAWLHQSCARQYVHCE